MYGLTADDCLWFSFSLRGEETLETSASLKLRLLGVRVGTGAPTPSPAIWDFLGLMGTKSTSFRSINNFEDADKALDRGGVRGCSDGVAEDQDEFELNVDDLKAEEKEELLRGEDLCDALIDESKELGTWDNLGRGVKLKAGRRFPSELSWKLCSNMGFGEVGGEGATIGNEDSDPARLCVCVEDGIAKERSSRR